jgi:IclR family pca regulon transcriptional regulator
MKSRAVTKLNDRSERAAAAAGDRNFVRGLARGLHLLAQFSPDSPRLTLAEISGKCGLPKTTTFRLLKTLTALGYTAFDSERQLYFPGPRVMSLGFSALASIDFGELARTYLVELSRTVGETVNLAVRDGLEVVYCDRVATKKLVHVSIHLGTRLPVHNTALGRCLLAFAPTMERQALLEQLETELPTAAYNTLTEQLRAARQAGYALNDGDLEPGIRAVAMPVWGKDQNLTAAVNVAFPALRKKLSEIRTDIVPPLTACTKAISLSLGAGEAWVDGLWRKAD